MKKQIKSLFTAAGLMLSLGLGSCVKDLDVKPIDPNINTHYSVEGLFNKCYANLALPGNGGANGDCDIDDLDGGTSGFVRQLFNSNVLTTDEGVCCWGDNGVEQFCFNTYDASHPMLNGFFYRLTTGISYCNQYLEIAADHDPVMKAEVRFLRALQYYYLMDAFGNVPFATKIGKPEYYQRAKLYDWLINELKEIEPDMAAAQPKKSTDAGYGRADKAACWMLLARLYLNAEIYTGKAAWNEAKQYAEKIIQSPYRIHTQGNNGYTAYQMLFMGDNGETGAADEAILPLLQDGVKTTSWATSLYLIASTADGDLRCSAKEKGSVNGTKEQWGGNRARKELLAKFFPHQSAPHLRAWQMTEAAKDDRALFEGLDRELEISNPKVFKSGYAVAKFTNFKTSGKPGSDPGFVDADFFLMRTAEAYLTYAEADARINNGKTTPEGAEKINQIRRRAHAGTKVAYSLNDILDEWSREFYFEGRRRTDLIRFGKFGGNSDYIWQWKGGSSNGRNFEAYKNLFALPAAQIRGDISQNPGYK